MQPRLETGFCVIVKGLKTAFFRHFLSSLIGKLRHLVMVLHASIDAAYILFRVNFFLIPKFVSGHIQS